MASRRYPQSPLIGACVAVWREDKVLLVCRSRPPNADKWALPGGLVEVGETLEQAAIREIHEETGLRLNELHFNRFHEIIRSDAAGKTEHHYVLAMYAAESFAGQIQAGDDAADAGWFAVSQLDTLVLTDHTKTFVSESRALLDINAT